MKLKNKKTGEIGYLQNDTFVQTLRVLNADNDTIGEYSSLAELNEEWEDAPKEHWFISEFGKVYSLEHIPMDKERTGLIKQIGNYFSSRKEAEQAVEKLKAWKRLKDTYYIRFDLDFVKNTISFTYRIDGTLHSSVNEERIIFDDMKTIFGGEE